MKEEKKHFKILLSLILVLFLAQAIFGYLGYTQLQKINTELTLQSNNLEQKTAMLELLINSNHQTLNQKILDERTDTDKKLKTLEDDTFDNFKSLESYVNKRTETLQLNLETKIGSVDKQVGGLGEKIGGLEEDIADINVQSSDFSKIIDEVVKTIVNIRTDRGHGSGVFFHQEGYILTNRHVISGARAILAVDYSSTAYPVEIIGVAGDVDLAVLKVVGADKSFDYLKFENQDNIQLGERVIAVGNPLGLEFSVTEGIISSSNRVIDGREFIQTDVPINQGNSGGPLVNSRRRIVGINTFKISSAEGLGFAIPSWIAEGIAEQAVE